jgi:anti-sigma-K factor RskA
MTQTGDHSEDDIVLIGEYALHLLDAESRLAFEKRLLDDAGLRQLLREWDEGLVTLADDITPIAPPPRLKGAIEARLFEAPAKRGFSLGALFGRRGVALGFVALIAVGILFGSFLLDQPQGPTYLAEIAAEDRGLVVEARFDPEAGEIDINRIAGAAVTGRVLELWLIAEGAPGPVSLGVLPASALAVVSVPEALRTATIGGTLAISDEPLGGSPTGAPTGAVLAVGSVVSS